MSDNGQASALNKFLERGPQPASFAQTVQQARPATPAIPGPYSKPELVKEAPAMPSTLPDDADDADLEVQELKSYGLARGKAGQVLMLELRQRSGDCEGVPYAYINRVRFNPSGAIHIFTSGDVIVIEGNHLGSVFRGLVRHAVVYVQELSRGHDQVGEGEPFVEGIRVEAGAE